MPQAYNLYLVIEKNHKIVMSPLLIRAKHNIGNYDLKFAEEATMQDLGEKILELTGVPISGQKLICSGKQLPKDLKVTLKEVLTQVESCYSFSFYLSKKYSLSTSE